MNNEEGTCNVQERGQQNMKVSGRCHIRVIADSVQEIELEREVMDAWWLDVGQLDTSYGHLRRGTLNGEKAFIKPGCRQDCMAFLN